MLFATNSPRDNLFFSPLYNKSLQQRSIAGHFPMYLNYKLGAAQLFFRQLTTMPMKVSLTSDTPQHYMQNLSALRAAF